MDIVPEPQWERLLEKLIRHMGTSMLIGATDSGKSTLAKYLIKRLVSENIKVSLVDSDVGQSSLGLPGAISMKIFCGQKDVEDFRFERMIFIGSSNPAAKFHLMIHGTKRMVEISKKRSEVVIIDTTGLISGGLGKALKIGKIKAVKPDHIIAVQRDDELEHILNLIENVSIHRIAASRMAKVRSREYRIRYRKKKFADYFAKTKISEFSLNTRDAEFFYNNKPFGLKDRDFEEGTIIGLNHNEDTMALGIITEIADNSITFRSPIRSLKGINRVVFGNITMELE
ncbi:Clp1/GlmU family protein [Dissulfurispira sp.]|uniref:Clp1/GlmU family protein n=1 Tax=Dissulfurispira sp. TaxID=2817609 RepID=UPI002FDB2FAF